MYGSVSGSGVLPGLTRQLVGDFKNSGRELRPKGQPEPVRVHDFEIPELGKAVPYGIYDIADNAGWLNLGISHDTAVFSVESIRRWVVRTRCRPLSHRDAAADHRGLRWQQRRAVAPVEAGTASSG